MQSSAEHTCCLALLLAMQAPRSRSDIRVLAAFLAVPAAYFVSAAVFACCRTSPDALIQSKVRELASIGPAGWGKALIYGAVCIPLWLATAVQIAVAAIKR